MLLPPHIKLHQLLRLVSKRDLKLLNLRLILPHLQIQVLILLVYSRHGVKVLLVLLCVQILNLLKLLMNLCNIRLCLSLILSRLSFFNVFLCFDLHKVLGDLFFELLELELIVFVELLMGLLEDVFVVYI